MNGPPMYYMPGLRAGSRFRGWGITWVHSLWNRTLGAWR